MGARAGMQTCVTACGSGGGWVGGWVDGGGVGGRAHNGPGHVSPKCVSLSCTAPPVPRRVVQCVLCQIRDPHRSSFIAPRTTHHAPVCKVFFAISPSSSSSSYPLLANCLSRLAAPCFPMLMAQSGSAAPGTHSISHGPVVAHVHVHAGRAAKRVEQAVSARLPHLAPLPCMDWAALAVQGWPGAPVWWARAWVSVRAC